MNGNNKTFIILSPGFPASEADSTCMPFPQLFVRALMKSHPSLKIIILSFQYPFIQSAYQWYGATIIPFNGQSRGKLHRLLLWKRVLKRIHNIRCEHPVVGILNFWLGECALIGHYAAKKHGLPSFTWLLGQDAKAGNRYFSLTHPSALQLVALSDSLAAVFYKNYSVMPAHIVPPGIDTTAYPSDRQERDIDILGAGSLIPLKQFDIFINVVRKLSLAYPGIRAGICGDGPERDRLQRIINDNALSGHISLYGELPHAEVLKLMQRARIFLHPSSYEGFATVLSESLYAGCQVISFCQPMKTVFKQQHTVETVDKMIATALRLLQNQQLEHNRIMTWPIETTVERMLSLYGM